MRVNPVRSDPAFAVSAEQKDVDPPVLSASGVGITFDKRDGPLLIDVSFDLFPGETIAVTGASGSGKTTLLSIVGGLLSADRGVVTYNTPDEGARHELSDRTRAGFIGMVFQSPHLIPTLSAVENVEVPMIGQGLPRGTREARAMQLLDQVGLSGVAGRMPAQLSGGERQRVGVARAFALFPKVILADEPTGNLDRATAETIACVLLDMTRDHCGALMVVTHDLALAARMDRQLDLHDGRLWAADRHSGDA